jgi:hypothetical protein
MRHYTPAAKATIKRDWLPEITFISARTQGGRETAVQL